MPWPRPAPDRIARQRRGRVHRGDQSIEAERLRLGWEETSLKDSIERLIRVEPVRLARRVPTRSSLSPFARMDGSSSMKLIVLWPGRNRVGMLPLRIW